MARVGQSKLYGITPAEGPQGYFLRPDRIQLDRCQGRVEC